jgi:hypothetical protein
MKNETTNYKGFTPPTIEELKKGGFQTYDIYTPLGGGVVHIETTDKNLLNLYVNDEMTEEDTWLVISQMNEWKEMIKNT